MHFDIMYVYLELPRAASATARLRSVGAPSRRSPESHARHRPTPSAWARSKLCEASESVPTAIPQTRLPNEYHSYGQRVPQLLQMRRYNVRLLHITYAYIEALLQ